MAISNIQTLLPLDEYARIMAIPGWLFNQVVHPARPLRGNCDQVWLQGGYFSDPNRILGRDDVAQAIATAEEQIAARLGYWPEPVWICGEEIPWPQPKRGMQMVAPTLKTKWGWVHRGGMRAIDLVLEDAIVVYTDEDGDGVLDTATITVIGLYNPPTSECEIIVVPRNMDPESREWRIRPLTVSVDSVTGDITITGPRWLFVEPIVWRTIASVSLDDDTSFATRVDVYRQYNDPQQQAQIVWDNPGDLCNTSTGVCVETCQNACLTVVSRRPGLVTTTPATYNTGVWTYQAWLRNVYPTKARLWYLAGYDGRWCQPCNQMGARLKEAIVRLANVYMIEPPCGCGVTEARWKRDREEMSIDSTDVVTAQSTFGTTARGAIFALSVVNSLPKMGKGG